ncbi:hypothetical protein GCM10007971_25170 [Oceanobacillus indicireducens]|uniref:Uncharacterized protein n=1 Tax=Oceanobacillus indicireducens TaxID=1004261 RepID=A0A918D2G0_9BACI|nr:hypothetical protein GCM10007971_25170 [Oceanobacillus indicireducens]
MEIKNEVNSLTYSEYLQAYSDLTYEVIANYIYNMSPSPSVKHQMISGEIDGVKNNESNSSSH